ncbi:hypothetical protein FRB90_012741 [Tulasnella sp. 427]|nr:hypothetical protein FRB90_012741 [Tulasnella sp. 427]
MDHLYPRRYVPPGEKQALNLTDLYAWLILGSQGTVSFAAWTTFLQDLRESIPALPLQAPVKALAETCLEGIIHEAINKEEEVTRALARLQLGSLPTPAEDRAERLIQEAANASLQGIMAESWAVVPTPQDVVGEPEDDGEEDLAPGEADVALSSPQNSGGHFVIPAPVRSDDGDDEEDSPQVSEDSFVDTVDMLDEEEIRIELPSRRRSLLLSPTTSRTYSTSKTFGDYPATPRSSRWSHHSLASPPESPESEPELEVSSSTEAATSNIRFHPLVNDRATSHVVPAHRLEVKEERPGVIGWLKRIGKGIASVMEG